MTSTKALVVLSGGQDSSTCLFWATRKFGRENVSAITFDYDQRHRIEIEAAVKVAELARVAERHEIVVLGPILKGASPLTDSDQQLEQYDTFESMEQIIGDRVETTFVPLRNALFLTLAGNAAAALGATYIVTGVCQADNANYPDCRRSFVDAQEVTINLALGVAAEADDRWMRIATPLMDMSKARSIQMAMSLEGAYSALAFTHTAYDGQYPPVGKDHATVLRARGFQEAKVPDPLVLRAWRQRKMELPKTPNYSTPNVAAAMDLIAREMPGDWWVD